MKIDSFEFKCAMTREKSHPAMAKESMNIIPKNAGQHITGTGIRRSLF